MATAEDVEETADDGPDGTVVEDDREHATGETDRYTRKKSVLITGCSSGIGRATARAFLAADWQVFATARTVDDLADLEEAGCETLALDVTDPEAVASAVEETVDIAGSTDCVVNNAGYAQMGPLEDVATVDLHRQFDVNVYGPHRLTRAALPHMRAQGEGRIINVSSVVGRISLPGAGAYAGSKHALEAMSDALRGEVSDFGVDVVLVEPGPVATSFQDRVEEELPEDEERTLHAYGWLYDLVDDWEAISGDGPLSSSPEDVARVVVDAASVSDPAARYPVGPVAKAGEYTRFLPDSTRERIIRLVKRLTT